MTESRYCTTHERVHNAHSWLRRGSSYACIFIEAETTVLTAPKPKKKPKVKIKPQPANEQGEEEKDG